MQENKSARSVRKGLKTVLRWLLALLGFLFVLSLLIQIPFIQNGVVRAVGNKISKDLQTAVQVGHVNLNFFDDLALDDLLILDEEGDTLLYSKKTYLDIDNPIKGLVSGEMRIEEVTIEDASVYLKTAQGGKTNYQFLLDYLVQSPEGRVPEQLPVESVDSTPRLEGLQWMFAPAEIHLRHIAFTHKNDHKGKYTYLVMPRAEAQLERSTPQDPLHFSNVQIFEPQFLEDKFPVSWEDSPATSRTDPTADDVVQGSEISSTDPPKPLAILVDQLRIYDGTARVINKYKPVRYTLPTVIDLRDATAQHLNVELTDLLWQGSEGSMAITQLYFDTEEGFEIESLTSRSVTVGPQKTTFEGMALRTPNSYLTDRITFRYNHHHDFGWFEDRIRMTGSFDDSYVALKDILFFANKLNNNEFFQLNGNQQVLLSGHFDGTVNDLTARNISLQLADQGYLKGDLSLKDITRPGQEDILLDLEEAQVDMLTLRQLIPNFNAPDSYDKLGLLNFSGDFQGSFRNFAASGFLQTALGDFRTNLLINIPAEGVNEAAYSGDLEMIDFDLAQWTESDLYSLTSFTAEVSDGHGLSIDNAFANLYAKLDKFYYKGYDYSNAILQGELNRSYFDGQFFIQDPHVSLDFNGSIDFSDTVPAFDFEADVNHLDLYQLNLSKKPVQLAGDIDFNFYFHDVFNIDGSAVGRNIHIEDAETTYDLDTASIFSQLDWGGQRSLTINSDIANFMLHGSFDLEHLPRTIRALAQAKHPEFAKQFNADEYIPDSLITENDFLFEGYISDSRGLQRLYDTTFADIKDLTLNGHFTNGADKQFDYRIYLHSPSLAFGNNAIYELSMQLDGQNENSRWDLHSDRILVGKKEIRPLSLAATLISDSLNFSLKSEELANAFSDVNLSGLFYLNEGYYQVDLANSSFDFLDEPWQIIPDNYLQVGDKYLKTKNLVFLSDDSYLRVSSPGDNSLKVETEKLDISFIDDFFRKRELAFKGFANSTIDFKNIFSKDEVSVNLDIDSLWINDDFYGHVAATAHHTNLASPGVLDFGIVDEGKSLMAHGTYFFPVLKEDRGRPSMYDLDFEIDRYPIGFAEYFIGHSISGSTGTVTASVHLTDQDRKPHITGTATLNGSTQIDYLGTTYQMEDQTVIIRPTLFDFTGTEFIDVLGNRAQISGGITHDYLTNFGLNTVIASDRFQFLNTTKEDNILYYGTGIGNASIEITGNFIQADMRIKAVTGPGSKIHIPVDYDYGSQGEHFIRFVFEEDSLLARDATVDLRGINLDMQLAITPDAEMQIIFDEFSGDIIRGTGNGNLTMTKERGANFQMTGKYVIEQGQYLYTLLDFINKPFLIERGGVITWSGDPLAADLDIQAKYTGLRVPPRNLIAEYLEGQANSRLADFADISTTVDLVLLLRGILSQPEIDFDIQFPEIAPDIKNVVESKMRVLKEDVSELNRQVYGLLFFNSFLPPTTNLDLTATTVNTLSEFITSQLSNYVAAYISQGVEDVDYISGVDFYFDYNYYRSEDFIQGQQTGVKSGSEFALAPNIRFFDDRLAFSPGASVIEGTVLQGSTFIGTDVKLDFFLTEDKRLKLSLFYKRFPSLEGSRNKLGLGFRFSRSYDSFSEIFKRKKQKKSAKPATPGTNETADISEGN